LCQHLDIHDFASLRVPERINCWAVEAFIVVGIEDDRCRVKNGEIAASDDSGLGDVFTLSVGDLNGEFVRTCMLLAD
jgi:hypothetical protein